MVVLTALPWLVPVGCDRPALTADADVLAVLEEPRDQAEQAAMIDLGRRLYLRNSCHNCHALDGKAGNGAPQLRNLYTTQAALADGSLTDRDRAYVVRSILRPSEEIVVGYPQLMTNAYRTMPAEEVAAIIAYLEQFSPPAPEVAAGSTAADPPSEAAAEPDSPPGAGS